MTTTLGWLDNLIIFAYLAAMVGISLYYVRRNHNQDDYYVGGRQTGGAALGCLWMASWIGGATVVGSADKAYDLGLTALWYCGSMAIGCLIFALTSSRLIQRVGSRFNCLTYPDLIEQRYGPGARLLATVTTFLAYLAYTAGQFLAMGKLLNGFLGWGLTESIWFSAAIMVAYTALGGFLAVTATGVLQALIIVFTLALVMSPILVSRVGGLDQMFTSLPPGFMDIGAWGWLQVAGLVVTIILTFYTSMDSYTRCFAARDGRASRNGALLASVMVLSVAFSTTLVGLSARVLLPDLPPGTTAVNAMLTLMPMGIKGLILIGLFAAIMSTGSVCLLVASANITQDVYKRFLNPGASGRHLIVLGGLATLAAGILSVYLAIARQDVIGVLYIAFTINSAGLFIPTMAAFLWKRGGAGVAAWSIGLSLAVVVFWYVGQGLWPETALFKIDPVWPGLAVSALVFLSGAWLGPLSETDRQKIAAFQA